MRNRVWCLRLDRARASPVCASACAAPLFSIPPLPIRCRNRVTNPSRRQHQAPLQDMSLPRQRMSAYRIRPLALTEGHRPQKRVRSTTGPAPSLFVRRRRLIPTITRLSDMATVARGCGDGTAIGSEPRPVRDRKAASPKSSDHVTAPAKQRATFR